MRFIILVGVIPKMRAIKIPRTKVSLKFSGHAIPNVGSYKFQGRRGLAGLPSKNAGMPDLV